MSIFDFRVAFRSEFDEAAATQNDGRHCANALRVSADL